MKYLLVALVLFMQGKSDPRGLDHDRIELLDHGWAGRDDARVHFSVYHDKDSKAEFICAQTSTWNNDAGIGCFTTGRKW